MSNALHPDRMTAAERLDEVAEMLATGYLRWRLREARTNARNSKDLRDNSLDFSADQSVHDIERGRKGEAR